MPVWFRANLTEPHRQECLCHTNSSLDRFPVFAALGVVEIWRYDGRRVAFHTLEGMVDHPIEKSILLPPMIAAEATVFLGGNRQEDATTWLRSVRNWIRSQS
jgi:hypothetical protein